MNDDGFKTNPTMMRGRLDPMSYALLHGCRSVDHYERLNRIQEGSYGVVSRARCVTSGDLVALKRVKMGKVVHKEGFPITAIREINVLLALRHRNIIRVREMVVGRGHGIFMVMDYVQHDLKTLLSQRRFMESEVKCLLRQLCLALEYMHDRWFMHRDIKSSNLLYGNDGVLRVCDFGLARRYGEPLRSYTLPVVTLWYRSPELLFDCPRYDASVDMWSVGCVFTELILTAGPLFSGKGEMDQIRLIFQTLGTPTKETWSDFSSVIAPRMRFPHIEGNRLRAVFPQTSFTSDRCPLSNEGLSLLQGLLSYDPAKRTTAREALDHAYFDEMPRARAVELMPTFAETNDRRHA